MLPEDARFCHKCGAPQYQEDVARLAQHTVPAPVLSPVTNPAAPVAGVSFRNSRAVWITCAVAAVTLFAMAVIGYLFLPLFPVVLCAAGFVATRLYNQSATQPLNAAGGARLGWMTGLWVFLALAIVCAIVAVAISNPNTWAQIKSAWAQLPQTQQIASLTPHEVLKQLLFNLPVSFLIFTLLPGLGGMLGAKFSRRRP
jgi:hypothetical protein